MARPRNSSATAATLDDSPIYARIVKQLRAEIEAGIFAVGTVLPSESALSDRFGVSRHTIREALRALREEALIESRQGAGTRVAPRVAKPIYTYAITSVDELVQYATDARYQIAKSGIVITDKKLAERLNGRVGEHWLRVVGPRHTSGQDLPLCWTELFIPNQYAGIGLMLGRRVGTVYSFIEEIYNVRVTEVKQTLITCKMPDEALGELQLEAGSLAILLHRVYHLVDGSPALIAFNYHPPERLRMVWTFTRNSPTGLT